MENSELEAEIERLEAENVRLTACVNKHAMGRLSLCDLLLTRSAEIDRLTGIEADKEAEIAIVRRQNHLLLTECLAKRGEIEKLQSSIRRYETKFAILKAWSDSVNLENEGE